MYPDDEYRDIGRQYAKHENEDRVDVVVEIIMSSRSLDTSASCKDTFVGLSKERILTVSLASRSARVQVASCTMQASRYAN